MPVVFFGIPWRRALLILLGSTLILFWQVSLVKSPPSGITETYTNKAASGLIPERERAFAYALYWLGLYPIRPLQEPGLGAQSVESAAALLAAPSTTLMVEYGAQIRKGEHLSRFLYLVDAVYKRSAFDLSLLPANAIFTIISLIALFASFACLGETLFGTLLVGLLGSSPNILAEMYLRENILGWSAVACILMAAALAPVMHPRGLRWRGALILCLLAGVVLGTLRHVRSETVVLALGPLIAACLARRLSPYARIAMAVGFLITFAATDLAWQKYFASKIEHVTREFAGRVSLPPGGFEAHHLVWHAIWCGLGDFDTKYGFEWNDGAAEKYAMPILERDYGIKGPERPFFYPEYSKVIRDSVVGTIESDPVWYAEILVKRVQRLATELTPLRLGLSGGGIEVAVPWPMLLVCLCLLIFLKRWFELSVLLLFLPVAIPSLVVFSGQGMTYASHWHMVLVAGAVSALLTAAWSSLMRSQRRGAPAA